MHVAKMPKRRGKGDAGSFKTDALKFSLGVFFSRGDNTSFGIVKYFYNPSFLRYLDGMQVLARLADSTFQFPTSSHIFSYIQCTISTHKLIYLI
jgi:hypothetical protein